MTVVYDDKLGYPSFVDLDYSKNTFDDELQVSVSDFKVIKR